MSNEPDDAPDRSETTPHGRKTTPYDQPGAYGQQHGQPEQYRYGQQQYPPADYGQQYGQQYGQGRPTGYGQQSGYDPSQVPARPGAVITSAVLGFVFAAFGVLATLGLLVGGALINNLVDAVQQSNSSVGTIDSQAVGSVRAVLVVCGVVALAWTVLMVWGGVLAVRGRSRVLLLVGGSIAILATGLTFIAGLAGGASNAGGSGNAGGIIFLFLLFAAAIAIVVLLCVRPAGQFFAAHRAQRGRRPTH